MSEFNIIWFLESAITLAISLAYSIFLTSKYDGFAIAALPTSSIETDSAWALIMMLFLTSLAYSTWNLARSASYWAIYLASIASKYSFPKVNSVIDTSSILMLKVRALSSKLLLILAETYSLWESNYEALYCAITALKTSLTMEGNTLSW